MLIKIPNTLVNGHNSDRWINLDNVLYLVENGSDESSIILNVSSGEKNKLASINEVHLKNVFSE